MKKILFYFTFGLIIVCCKNDEIKDNHVIISGEIKDFDVQSEYQSIQFYVDNLFGLQNNYTAYIDDSGHFQFRLKQFYPQVYYMRYKYGFSFYLNPGDSINISIDSDLLNTELTNETERYNYFHITGDAQEINRDYLKYAKFIQDSVYVWNPIKASDAITNMNPEEYKKYIEEITAFRLEKVSEFNERNNTCRQFRKYVKNSLQFGALNDLMRYRLLHPYLNNIKPDSFQISSEYYSFLKEIEFNNEALMISNEYLHFLEQYLMYLNNEALPPDTLKKIRETFKNNKISGYQLLLNNITKNSSGFLEQIQLAKFFYQFLDWNDPETFDTLFNPVYFSNTEYSIYLEEQYMELVKNLKNPEYYTDKILSDLKLYNNNILTSIIDKYPDKVLYIEFWAPWCGPCMGEMKFANELHEKYKDKDIEFVFLANRCTEKSWKLTIAKENIKGTHIMLDDNQFTQLSEKLKFSGIPHYILIDKNGVIVNNNAPRPSNKEIVTAAINKLLEEM
jgi:thiol-disulfide isomerase/thioredoxin